jgi:hypothetical protein
MPPRQYSRHTFTIGEQDSDEKLFLTDRIAFSYEDIADNRRVVAQEGDTIFSLAAKYFRGLPRPAGFWWVIADFQPQPIHDPTIQLAAGQVIVIPSIRTISERLFNEERRRESDL